MDFKKTFQDLKEKARPYLKKTEPYIEKAKDYGEKALDFTLEQAAATPVFLQNEEAVNIHFSSRRSILFSYDETDDTAKNLALLFPVWGTKAWMDAAELRFISLSKSKDLAKTLKISGPVEMKVSFEGKEFLRTNDIAVIKEWWNNRCYTEAKEAPVPKENAPNDPLAGS
jgi:hypothetical protein